MVKGVSPAAQGKHSAETRAAKSAAAINLQSIIVGGAQYPRKSVACYNTTRNDESAATKAKEMNFCQRIFSTSAPRLLLALADG